MLRIPPGNITVGRLSATGAYASHSTARATLPNGICVIPVCPGVAMTTAAVSGSPVPQRTGGYAPRGTCHRAGSRTSCRLPRRLRADVPLEWPTPRHQHTLSHRVPLRPACHRPPAAGGLSALCGHRPFLKGSSRSEVATTRDHSKYTVNVGSAGRGRRPWLAAATGQTGFKHRGDADEGRPRAAVRHVGAGRKDSVARLVVALRSRSLTGTTRRRLPARIR